MIYETQPEMQTVQSNLQAEFNVSAQLLSILCAVQKFFLKKALLVTSSFEILQQHVFASIVS